MSKCELNRTPRIKWACSRARVFECIHVTHTSCSCSLYRNSYASLKRKISKSMFPYTYPSVCSSVRSFDGLRATNRTALCECVRACVCLFLSHSLSVCSLFPVLSFFLMENCTIFHVFVYLSFFP